MSPELLFSFLLFFQVQVESIKESGFYKILAERYPEISQSLSNPRLMDPEFRELLEASGVDLDDLVRFGITIEGFDGIGNASQEGRSPKFGSELDFFFSAKFNGKLDANAIFSFILEKLVEEKGEGYRRKVEKTITKKDKSSSISIPSELLDQAFSETDLRVSILSEGDSSRVLAGLPGGRQIDPSVADDNASLACLKAMAKDRQITFGIRVDPALWERPEFNSRQQNPLFAGLANSIKGIREFGLAISFRDGSLGLEICVHCKDTQSSLGLWTVAQGGLGMAQVAMAQEGGRAPSVLTKIKTQAVGNNLFVRLDLNEDDLDELESMQMIPMQGQSETIGGQEGDLLETDPLVGLEAPDFETELMGGSTFKISDHRGKVVVLDFWATWCGPCVRALPELVEKTSGFSKEEFLLVAVNQGETRNRISQFLESKKLKKLSVAIDQKRKVGEAYHVQGIPKTVVIDAKGVIRHVEVGFTAGMGSRLKGKIQALLQK